jgi:hypothetical protein
VSCVFAFDKTHANGLANGEETVGQGLSVKLSLEVGLELDNTLGAVGDLVHYGVRSRYKRHISQKTLMRRNDVV